MIRYKRLSKKIDIKDKESARITKRGKIKELERNTNDVEARVGKIQDLKGKVQELMLKSDKKINEINEWTFKIEGD